MPDELGPILLCVDLEHGSVDLAKCAARYAQCWDERLHVLFVMPQASKEPEQEAHDRVLDLLTGIVPVERIAEIALRRGSPEHEIVEYATECGIRMIILGRRYRSVKERIHVGSTTTIVVSHAACAVLVVPLDGNVGWEL